MEIRILGPLEVVDGVRTLELGGSRQRALLARLAISANRVISIDLLLDDLWGPDLGPASKQALQAQVSRIRRALGDASRLVARPPGYVLRVEPDELDAARFEALLARARTAAGEGDLIAAADLWADAERCWRGPVLAEFADYPVIQAEAARLEELRLSAIEARIQVDLDLGRHDRLVAELDGLVGTHPYRERLWAQLMLVLYRSGRQADALAAYQRVRRILAEELGIPPGPELCRLEEAVILQKPELDWAPPHAGPASNISLAEPVPIDPPHNLPRPRSTFVGRQDELDDLEKLLATPGLLTMVGPGGVGKTRLAVETARRLRSRYPDGVWLVELAAVADAALVPHTAAVVLGMREEQGRPLIDTLADALREHRALVVLDNCEHLIDAVAAFADALLAASATLTVLATSREPLRVEGEVVWHVPSLPVPPPGIANPQAGLSYDSLRLFCERAQDQGRFALDASNTADVADLCRRLDGIPLALELAAARTRALSAAEILARLDDRFTLLVEGRRTAPPRQQTLHAAIEWSHDLLSEIEQSLFRRLSVFVGTFSGEAVEAVCHAGISNGPDLVDVLSRLVEKSLVVAEASARVTRFRMLETIREYAARRLAERGETEDARDRHLLLYLTLAERAEPHLLGPEQAQWLQRLEAEVDNLHAAIAWSLESEMQDVSLRFTSALLYFWDVRGHMSEGLRWLVAALAASDSSSDALRAKALFAAGRLALLQGDWSKGETYLQECHALSAKVADLKHVSLSLSHLGWAKRLQGDVEASLTLFEDSLAAAQRQPEDKWTLAIALNNLGGSLAAQGNRRRGRQLLEESLKLRRELGDRRAVALALANLAELALLEEDYGAAASLYAESLSVSDELGYEGMRGQSLCGLALVALARHDHGSARPLLRQGVELAGRLRSPEVSRSVLYACAALASADCDWDRAARLVGAAETLVPGAGDTPEARVADPFVARARDNLRDQWTVRRREGQAMDVEQALSHALPQPDRR